MCHVLKATPEQERGCACPGVGDRRAAVSGPMCPGMFKTPARHAARLSPDQSFTPMVCKDCVGACDRGSATRRQGRGGKCTDPGHDVVVQAVHEVHELHSQEEQTVSLLGHWFLLWAGLSGRVLFT